MQHNIFSPKIQGVDTDILSSFFKSGAQIILTFVLALIPLWFVPELAVSFGLVKTAIVVCGLYLGIIFSALSLLRSGKINLYLPVPLLFFWLFTVSTFVSAFLSGDVFDSIFGDDFGVFTAGFTTVLAVVMTLCLVFVKARSAIFKTLLLGLAVVLGVYLFTIIRFIWGFDFLNFNVFLTNTSTIVGSLNDLALYAGLVLLISLVAIYRVPTNLVAQAISLIVILASLAILAVVNFSFLWVIICLLSLMTFFYLLARDTWLSTEKSTTSSVSGFALALVALIFLTSGSFIISGNYLSTKLSTVTDITYLEVRPSFSATTDIAKAVYKENILTGGGTNRFADSWRQFKGQVINETRFWNTNFNTGFSYVFTIAVNTGLLGLVFFMGFVLTFLRSSYRIIFSHKSAEKGWHTVGLIVVSAALYLWTVTFWYTPGVTIMLLTALFTGLTIAVGQTLFTNTPLLIDATSSRPKGFTLIASTIIILIVSTIAVTSFGRYFLAQVGLASGVADFAQTIDTGKYDETLTKVATAIPEQDTYPAERARLRLAELSRLSGLSEPTDEDKQLFESILVDGVKLTEQAIALDSTNPINYAILGSFYGFLNAKQYEGIAKRRSDAFAVAKKYDPQNPEYDLLEAQIASRFGETEEARAKLASAIALKGDYTDALFLLSQLDIQSGNATSAIATTRSIIKIEPDNPARRFQLGLLLLANADLIEATTAFESAIALDQNYANARYLLALTYLDLSRPEEALTQLKIVKTTNQEDKTLQALITQIENGDYSSPDLSGIAPVLDKQGVSESDNQTIVSDAPETKLVSPVNRVPLADKPEASEAMENSTNTTPD